MFIYCELGKGRGIPGDGPVLPKVMPGTNWVPPGGAKRFLRGMVPPMNSGFWRRKLSYIL